jgi:uncharacterized protein DUF6668
MTEIVVFVSPPRDEPTPRASGVLSAGVLPICWRADAHLQSRVLTAAEAHARCWWLGVHGGAGETTLAQLFAGVAAAEHTWPIGDGSRTSVVLVARTNFGGMSAAQVAMREWSANYRRHVDVLGLVLVADRPGKLPRPLLDLQHDLEGATPNLWRLPWVECWSLGEIPSRENAPTEAVEALRLGLTAALKNAARKAGN